MKEHKIKSAIRRDTKAKVRQERAARKAERKDMQKRRFRGGWRG